MKKQWADAMSASLSNPDRHIVVLTGADGLIYWADEYDWLRGGGVKKIDHWRAEDA